MHSIGHNRMEYLEQLYKSLEPIFDTAWWPFAKWTLVVILIYSIYITVRQLPKLAVYPILFASTAILLMTWVYNRTEPEVLSPFVDFLSLWLPSANS